MVLAPRLKLVHLGPHRPCDRRPAGFTWFGPPPVRSKPSGIHVVHEELDGAPYAVAGVCWPSNAAPTALVGELHLLVCPLIVRLVRRSSYFEAASKRAALVQATQSLRKAAHALEKHAVLVSLPRETRVETHWPKGRPRSELMADVICGPDAQAQHRASGCHDGNKASRVLS